MLDKLPGLWYIDHRPGNYNYFEIAERRLT